MSTTVILLSRCIKNQYILALVTISLIHVRAKWCISFSSKILRLLCSHSVFYSHRLPQIIENEDIKNDPIADFWKDVKTFFPQEYQDRHKVERRKRKHRYSLPGQGHGGRNAAARRMRNGGNNGGNVFAMWAGVCFVILFMMLGFTVFATTIGFVAWYFLELAMDMTVDLVLEMQSFSELFKTSIVVFCIDGGLTPEKWHQLYDAAGRVLGAFTKLVHTRNESEVGIPEWLMSSYRGVASSSYSSEAANKAYHMLWKMTQTHIANYVVFGCLVTFIMYRLAKYMQARRV